MKKIVYVTGSRAEFGLMLPTLKAISKSPRLSLFVIVTGMHLWGGQESLNFIKSTGLNIFRIIEPRQNLGTDASSQLLYAAQMLTELSAVFKEINPQMVLIEGDRFEQLAVAMAAASFNIPIAHTSGGHVTKSIDDSVRHSITKFANLHFPNSDQCAGRILKMGEEPWRIHLVGTPICKDIASKEETEKKLGVTLSKETVLVLQHPVSTQVEEAGEQMEITLSTVSNLNLNTIVIYPNGDPGSDKIIRIIQKYKERYNEKNNFNVFKNLEPSIYLGLLNNVGLLVGNSSSGIWEAPFFKLPAVNLGIRESGRDRAINIIDVDHNQEEIEKAIKTALSLQFREKLEKMNNPYKSENVEQNIVNVLEKIELNEKLLIKKMTY